MNQAGNRSGTSRRQLLRNSSLAIAGATIIPAVFAAETASSDMQVKIGLIGCGGRGTGAVLNAMGAATKVIYPSKGYHTEDADANAKVARQNIKVVALADVFDDRLNRCKTQLNKVGCELTPDRCFSGFDAYQKLLAVPDVNYVICATPPHFRPMHAKAAIEAGKHVFMEKPGAVDVPGVKLLLEAYELANQKKLGIACGTQRRHQKSYIETIKRIQDGAIGDIVYCRSYWNGGEIWVVARTPGMSDLEWQLRNWNYFTWLSGDHYLEQHVHNLDVINWVMGSHPVKVVAAVGGRQTRTAEVNGHIFDHFAVEYEYPNGVRMFSQARQIDQCDNIVQEGIVGTNGFSDPSGSIKPRKGDNWRYKGNDLSPYEQEHLNLIASIQAGKPINEAKNLAESTLTGIMGRESAYSGKAVTWEQAMASTKRLGPEKYDLSTPLPVPAVALPGKYKFS